MPASWNMLIVVAYQTNTISQHTYNIASRVFIILRMVLPIGVRQWVLLGMQNNFAQIWSCLSKITYKQQVSLCRLKRTIPKHHGVCMPDYQSSNTSNKSIDAWVAILLVQMKYCNASSLMWNVDICFYWQRWARIRTGLDQDWSQFWPDHDWIGLRKFLLL